MKKQVTLVPNYRKPFAGFRRFVFITGLLLLVSVMVNAQAPTITSFTPTTGPVGTLVTITGTNLSSPTAFTIGGVNAIQVSNSGTTLVGMVMPGATTGTISVTTAGGTATSTGSFTVTATPYPAAQLGDKLVGTGVLGAAQQGYSVAVSADGNTAIVGGPHDNSSQGAAWIYTRSGNTWSQQGKLVGTGNTGPATQGTSVAISADGNTAIVGGPSDNSSVGAVWVFTRSGTSWSQQGKLVGTGNEGKSQQGTSVAVSADGNTVIAGAQADGSYGAVWIFTRLGNDWSQQGGKLVGAGAVGASSAKQGFSVAISADGNTAIVGGYLDNAANGAAWIFTRSGSTWTQQGSKLYALTDAGGGEGEGRSVALSADGNTAIVGAYTYFNSNDFTMPGAAFVFTRSGTTWSLQAGPLTGTGFVGDSWQGYSVGLSADGNTAIIGGAKDNSEFGATWVFTRSGSTWTQQGEKLVGTGSVGLPMQGWSAALSADGKTLIVGGNRDNTDIGAAWVFAPLVPTITSFTPTTAGTGTFVSITGTNFTGATSVKFGGTEAVRFIVDNATTISAMVASGTTGTISVTTPAGTATSAGTFTYKPAFLTNLANAVAVSLGGSTTDYNGQAFTTGSNARNLSSVDLSITLSGEKAVVKIYSSSSGNMGSELASLTGTHVSGSIYNFTPASPVTLLANTTYWLVLYSTNSTNFDNTDDVTYTGTATIPSTNRTAFSANAGDTWDYYSDPAEDSYPYMFALYGDIFTSATWTGATSTAWNTAGNWNTNAVPTVSDNVTIPDVTNDPVIASGEGASCNNLTVNSGATLTVQSGGSLITEGTVTGNVTIERSVSGSTSLTQNKYHLVSVPLAASNIPQSSLFLGSYLYEYLPATNAWNGMGTSQTSTLDETKGYMIYYPGTSHTYSFTGAPNTGNFTPTVTFPGNSGGNNFALVPNPYPSNIDWNAAAGWTKTNIGASIWIYNNGNYAVWNGTSGTFSASRYIAVGQAFFVQTTASSPVLSMDNGTRTHTAATFLKEGNTMANQLRLRAEANTLADELLVGFSTGAGNGYDPSEDALKLYGDANAPQIYTLAGEYKASINALGELNGSMQVPLNYECGSQGEVAFVFSQLENFPANMAIRLEDKLTGQSVNLRQQQTYTFTHQQGNAAGRFVLHFNSANGVGDLTSATKGRMWINDHTLNIAAPASTGENARVEIFSMSGQQVFDQQVTLSELTKIPVNLSGMFVIRVTTPKEAMVTKGILK